MSILRARFGNAEDDVLVHITWATPNESFHGGSGERDVQRVFKMAKKKLRLHPVGEVEGGFLFHVCGKADSKDAFVVAERSEAGKPIPPGAEIGTFKPEGDDHVVFHPIRLGSGPLRVTSPSYRNGWDKTFGKNGVN